MILAATDWMGLWVRWIAAASWQLAVLAAIVAAAAWLGRRASPRLRYTLWLLVLAKVFLPPSWTAVWGVGAWGVAPLWRQAERAGVEISFTPETLASHQMPLLDQDESAAHVTSENASRRTTWAEGLFLLWFAGCLTVAVVAGYRYWRLCRATRGMQLVDEGPLRVELERIALDMGERRVPDLYLSETASSPFLFGVLRPAIVAPRELLASAAAADVHAVLLHEMLHWRRRDPWVGWVQVVALALFWFHPLVWLANARLRHEREAVCDEAVLRTGRCQPEGYGETLLRVLSAARGRSLAHGSLVGVFERGTNLQNRLEAIMDYRPDQKRFGAGSRAAVAAFALLFLPMAAPAGEQQDARAEEAPAPAATPDKGGVPQFRSNPKSGATKVDPALAEIVLVFDRPMQSGMSWTGGPPHFPPTDPERKPEWRDERTCVLPVKLENGAYYRLGVNSTSHQNFMSQDGVSARPATICFTTKGASRAVERRVQPPKVVQIEPTNGAADVDPGTKAVRVTFNMPMGGGFSWTGEAPTAPGQSARWSADKRTCILPVALKPGVAYKFGLNSPSHQNFQSEWGVPLKPLVVSFTTSGEPPSDAAADGPPRIVAMTPKNGATNVDPVLKVLRVTFDRPMAEGFSWTGGGPQFPTIPEGQMPQWSRDRRTCTLPVELKANHQYRLGLNSPSFKNFASAAGVPLEPVEYRFKTRAAKD